MSGWVRADPAVFAAGDVGGDTQVGDAWSARWVRQLPDGTWGVVDRGYYVADVGEGMYMECQTQYLICADPGDPGSSEIWSDSRYDVEYGVHLVGAAAYRLAETAQGPSEAEWVAVIPWAEAA